MNKVALIASVLKYKEGRLTSASGKLRDTLIHTKGYRRCSAVVGGVRCEALAHKVIWYIHHGDVPEGLMLDHINLDKTDNRIENLRLVTAAGNNQNIIRKGYALHKPSGRYRVKVHAGGKLLFSCYCTTEEEAKAAYLEAKAKYHPFATKHSII